MRCLLVLLYLFRFALLDVFLLNLLHHVLTMQEICFETMRQPQRHI